MYGFSIMKRAPKWKTKRTGRTNGIFYEICVGPLWCDTFARLPGCQAARLLQIQIQKKWFYMLDLVHFEYVRWRVVYLPFEFSWRYIMRNRSPKHQPESGENKRNLIFCAILDVFWLLKCYSRIIGSSDWSQIYFSTLNKFNISHSFAYNFQVPQILLFIFFYF